MAKAREITWPEEYKDLKRIEEFMICGICYEYINTSVMTPCSHNYCSVCIRKYLHYKTQCPACFHDFFEKDLYVNRSMDGLINHYLQVREKILSLIENRNIYNSVKQLEHVDQIVQPPSTPPVRPARNSQILKSPKPIVERKEVELKEQFINSPVASSSKSMVSSPVAVKSPKVLPSIAKMFNTPKRKELIVSQPVPNTKTVACPVCSVDISEQNINVHLDACLKRDSSQGIAIKKQPKRPLMPKLVLHVMKEAELRKKMKEFGLSTVGDRKTLENRFTRYSVIYNAECDKSVPRPANELIRQCEMEEKQERKMDCFLVAKTSDNRLQIERNAKEEKIEEAQKNYRLVNKSSFDKLIEEVRNRKKMEKNNKQTEQQGSQLQNDEEAASSSSKPSTSGASAKSVTSISENEESPAFVQSTEVTFQDSDSDEACPLQLYTSDNMVKSLSVNLDDSSSCTSVSGSPVKRSQKTRFKKSDQPQPSVSETVTQNPYEMETDEGSSDEEISSSPLVAKNKNRKKIKLSNESFKKSVPTTIEETDGFVSEKGNLKTAANNMCNSIIKDFSFDDSSDDSSSEFADKHQCKNNSNVKHVKLVAASKGSSTALNKSTLQGELDTSCNTKSLKGDNNCTEFDPEGKYSSDVLSAIFTEDDFDEFVNTTVTENKGGKTEKLNESEKAAQCESNVPIDKENHAASANEGTISRPVRKRNPPVRFTEKQPTRRATREKTPGLGDSAVATAHEDDLPNSQRSVASEGGSLKRRRGRPKAGCTDQPADEVQNPPKRPVRRRQTVAERDSC